MKFHMTYGRSRPDMIVPYAEWRGVPLMTSAATRYSETSGLMDLWQYDTDHVVDSGGYTVMQDYGGYPWSVDEYHEWLQSQGGFEWAAVMDYACESRFDDKMSVDERVDKTIDNTIEHFDKDPEYELMPVLQGRSVEKYVECYDRLKDHGIPLDRVGLGTVCRISSSKEIVETEKAIRDRTGVDWIHGFGVKINAYKMGAGFESADSQAWVYPASRGQAYIESDGRLLTVDMPDDSKTRTYTCFKSYYDYVNRIDDFGKSFPCGGCGFEASTKAELADHCFGENHPMS